MLSTTLRRASRRDFIVQQGLSDPHPGSPEALYSALQFQPRLIGLLALAGAVSGSADIFLALGVVLWWNVAKPRWNPFDMVYNRLFARRDGVCLMPARPPRLFAQAIAGSLSLSIAALLATGNPAGALLLEGTFILAVAGVVFGRFCFGTFLYHALNRRGLIPNRTMRRVCRTA
jgi:hypothetical protein